MVVQDQLSLNAGQKYFAILSTFIRLPLVFKTFGLSVLEWPLKTDFTVLSRTRVVYTFLLSGSSRLYKILKSIHVQHKKNLPMLVKLNCSATRQP